MARCNATAACAAILLACTATALPAQTVVPPMSGAGPNPVGCTNVEQDFSRVPSGETADMYWRGVASDGKERYVDALLVSPASALTATFVAPGDADLYDRWAGTPVDYVFIACYPTTATNTRADYVLPGGAVVPRMQRGAEPPMLPASPASLPLIVDSHGYAGSPLGDAYLAAMVSLASWGYVTVAPFHGDLRYSVLGPEDKRAAAKVHVPIWSEFVAMQALRALSVSAALDTLFARAEWRDRLDATRIGGFGVSQGGETMMLVGGAGLTYDAFNLDRHKAVTHDTRVRAAVGYVPYFGVDRIPAFGGGQAGATGMLLPFLALSGTSDPVAPDDVVRTALDRMAGPRGHVLLDGQGHDLDPGSGADIVTWTLTFLSAWVEGDAAARARLLTVEHVDGGLDDHKVLYVDPTGVPPPGVVADVVEFHNAALDHYFITAFPEEAAALDAGVPPGWVRTGKTFKAWRSGTGPGSEACRFFGTPGRGPNSHFYTVDAGECAKVRANPDWTFEALAFRAVAPLASGCAPEYQTVTRLYNNGMGGQANHRYLTASSDIDATLAQGWSVEGPVFCVPP